MQTVYLALGSNVGDSQAFISKAIDLIGASITNIVQAPVYRSKAVGFTNQPDFLNTVIQGQTELSAQELLKFVKSVEKKVGRVERFRWGPREIDIDIIFYGDQIIKEKGLTIPHSRFRERDFVLKPLCDLSPDTKDPVSHQSISELLHSLTIGKHSITSQ